ncbi:MAG: hypothetical protein E6R03_16095 [Hyphomicrobiaceae bacterium]|nr:MAG: hypothetical protein E6R03_16095 [Hyphomicrobiaceae bacterium]
MRVFVFLVALFAVSSGAMAQVTPTYEHRYVLSQDRVFTGRVMMAVVNAALAVAQEDPGTPNHEIRVKGALAAVREPDSVARRVTMLAAAVVPVTVTNDLVITANISDAQLQSLISDNWVLISNAMVGTIL